MKLIVYVMVCAATCAAIPQVRMKKRSATKEGNNLLDVTDEHSKVATPRLQSLVPMTSLLHQADKCMFKHCYPGEHCVVDGLNGRATCVCRKHCRPVDKPICGTDGEYYTNRCEMHKSACMAGGRLYDARHKDCFYKRSICDITDLKLFQNFLLEYHQSSVTMTRHDDVISTGIKTSSLTKRDVSHQSNHHKKYKKNDHVIVAKKGWENDVSKPAGFSEASNGVTDDAKTEGLTTSFMTTTSISYLHNNHDAENFIDDVISDVTFYQPNLEANLLYDDIISSDVRGETVKQIFRLLDVDMDGRVGSEEIYEVSLMEDLDSILPPPCSLYHLLHRADLDGDHVMDVQELFKLYNITILRLNDEDRYIHQRAVYGSSFTLECGIQGETMPIWRRHDYDIAADAKNDIQAEGSRLHFAEIHPRNAGNYTCHARVHTDIFQTISVSVISRPTVQVYPTMQHQQEGNDVTMSCHVTGVPSPSVTWLLDGKVLRQDGGRYLLMENRTELHINSAEARDSAAYTCLGSNPAGESEEVATVIVHSDVTSQGETHPSGIKRNSGYFVFHENGVTIVDARACMVLRFIGAGEPVPGLLRQNKLCKAISVDGRRLCKWSQAVAVGLRFVYAAQPEENRLVVVDLLLQRVIEVIATDAMPVSLQYVPSTDQLFVLCWVDLSRERSTLQVVHAAGILGVHSAAQIQPLDGGTTIDQSVMNFFVPPEGAMNARSRHGFVSHREQQLIYKLDLETLLFDDDVIDLRSHGCVPRRFSYQPIGGRLSVTCENGDNRPSVTVECASGRVVSSHEGDNFEREFVSMDARHVVRVEPRDQRIRLFNVTDWGDLVESINLHTNFRVSDVAFQPKLSSADVSTVYISSEVQDDVMHLDPSSGIVQVIGGLPQPVDQSQNDWPALNRPLVPSSWYDRHLATSGENQLVIIDVISNDVTCRLNNVNKASAIVWADGPL